MFDKIFKFFEDTANEAKAEIDEEEYLASYDVTAGKILRGEEVNRPEEKSLEQWACNDPIQKGILTAITDFEKIQKEIRRQTVLDVAKAISIGAKEYD